MRRSIFSYRWPLRPYPAGMRFVVVDQYGNVFAECHDELTARFVTAFLNEAEKTGRPIPKPTGATP